MQDYPEASGFGSVQIRRFAGGFYLPTARAVSPPSWIMTATTSARRPAANRAGAGNAGPEINRLRASCAADIQTAIPNAREPRAKRVAFQAFHEPMRVTAFDGVAARHAIANQRNPSWTVLTQGCVFGGAIYHSCKSSLNPCSLASANASEEDANVQSLSLCAVPSALSALQNH